jgi:hypothetical protein
MNSPYDTDTSAQTSQLRPDTFQHGSTWSYRNPTSNFDPFVLDWLRSLPGGAQLQETPRPLSYSLHTMNSPYDTGTSAQTSDTFQHGSTWSYQNPTSNFNPFVLDWLRSLLGGAQLQETSRPLSYSEFIERTEHHWQSLKNDSKPLKVWLRLAESIYKDAKIFDRQVDLESAFVEYAKAATIVLEKIPAHTDYRVPLGTTQLHNMGLVSYFC